MPYGGGYNDLSSADSKLNRCKFIKNPKKGAILIEFALAVPVLFSLIYYVHDLYVLKRTKSQVNFMAEIMTNVIQNISQNRTDKRITLRDLNYARATAGLTYYGGTSHYSVNKNNFRPLKSCLEFYMYLAEGTGHNRCKLKWGIAGGWFRDTPDNIGSMGVFNYQSDHSIVRYNSRDTESSSIYQSLQIENGQLKIIVDLCLETVTDTFPTLKKFGLYLVSPKKQVGNSSTYFHSVIIFTPKPGLFSETPPE